MNLINKILIIFTVFIATAIIFNLLKERTYLYNISEKNEPFAIFGKTSDGEKNDIESKFKKSNLTIVNSSDNDNLPLKDYVYKASFNSAVSGDFVSPNMINLVLSRGCRFLDFEVLIIDDVPCVTYTKDSEYMTRETDNHITLDSALTTVATSAFTSLAPNPNDPLFIHLRVKSKNDRSLKHIASSIDATISKSNKLYIPKFNKKSSNKLIRHQHEEKIRETLKKSKTKITDDMLNFSIYAPNYMNFNGTQSEKNKIAMDIVHLFSDPNEEKLNMFNSELSKYKEKNNLLKYYKDNDFSALHGKYISNDGINNNPPGIEIPDHDLVNFFSYNPRLTQQYISKHIIPKLSKSDQIIDLGSIKLKDIKGKIILLVDNSNFSNFNELSSCKDENLNCYDINNYIFSKSNNNYFQKMKFNDIIDSNRCKQPSISDDGTINTPKITIGVPDTFSGNNIENPDIRTLIFNHGIQIPCFKYYNLDENLIIQEKMFNSYKSAIVPFNIVMSDLKACNEEDLKKCYVFA
jgi:hypothetical protein